VFSVVGLNSITYADTVADPVSYGIQASLSKIHPKNSYEFTYDAPVGTAFLIKYLSPSIKSNTCNPSPVVTLRVPFFHSENHPLPARLLPLTSALKIAGVTAQLRLME
jgi:hypothetical protein